MNSSIQITLPWVLIVLVLITIAHAQHETFHFNNTKCPGAQLIAPCDCTTDFFGGTYHTTVNCGTDEPNPQDVITNAFRYLRASNVVGKNDRLELYRFMATSTSQLTTLDLTTFAKSDFYTVDLSFNRDLGSFLAGTNSTEEVDITPYRFSVVSLDIWGSHLTDPAVAEFFKFLEPLKTTSIMIAESNLTTVPDLSLFNEVTQISFGYNQITKIGGGQFKNMRGLNQLMFQWNHLNEIGENAFLREDATIEEGRSFDVALYYNNLKDESFHENNGLDSLTFPSTINLGSNLFEFISATKFEKFLMANPENYLYMSGNPLICDDRMKWLKDGRDLYEHELCQ